MSTPEHTTTGEAVPQPGRAATPATENPSPDKPNPGDPGPEIPEPRVPTDPFADPRIPAPDPSPHGA